jgi:hypothetical protein
MIKILIFAYANEPMAIGVDQSYAAIDSAG